jgi:DNA primase
VPRYTSDSRDRVRDAVDMVKLVESKVELRRAGVDSYFGCCPFHDERTASFHVRPDEKHYHCFGCSESGDPFDFLMGVEGLDFKGALEELAERFGVTLETVDEDPEAEARRKHRERLYSLLTRTATFYERMLWESREGRPARDYLLTERGLSEDVLRKFRVGWSPDAWDRVLLGSRGAGFSDEEMLAAGLIQRSRKDTSRLYDRFRRQIMFPTADARGRVIGFGGRKMPDDDRDWLGKYINTAEIENGVYSKRTVLYGINEARQPAAKAGRMVLAEGYIDVIALHQAGVLNAVGVMGTKLTKEQIGELVRLVSTLELCLDADTAGQEAMARAAQLCAETGLELRVVALPTGADPGGLIKSGGPQALRDRVTTSVPYVVFEVERLLEQADLDSAEGKDRAIAALAPALARVPESVLRDELMRRIAGALGIADSRLATLLAAAIAASASASRGAGANGGRGGSGGGLAGPPPSWNAREDPGPADDGDFGEAPVWDEDPSGPSGPAASPMRPVPQVRGGAAHGVRQERHYLAACLAGGEAGRAELQRIDPDVLLTSAVLRRAARRLVGQMEISPGVVAVSPEDPESSTVASDAEVSAAIDDLETQAARATRIVTAEELEHARLLLELARVSRDMETARAAGQGVPNLAWQKHEVLRAISEVTSRISVQSEGL